MMLKLPTLTALAVFLASCFLCGQPNFDVPASYPTIQDAINAATTNGVVRIAPGTYTGAGNRDLSTLGKAITIRGTAGPAATVIDVQGSSGSPSRGLIVPGSSGGVLIEGLTIRNAYTSGNGAGIWSTGNANLTIRNCIFDSCTGFNGGAVSVEGTTSASLEFCHFTQCAGDSGGALNKQGSGSLTVLGCTFQSNTSSFAGGALIITDGPTTFQNCLFANNISVHGGAGWLFLFANVTFNHCTFLQNSSTPNSGGALICQNPTAWMGLYHCSFSGNTSSSGGGALAVNDSNWLADACSFVGNTSLNDRGGAIASINSQGELIRSTLLGNTAQYEGGAMDASFGGSVRVSQCTVEGNVAIQFHGGGLSFRHDTTAALEDTTIENNTSSRGSGLNMWINVQVTAERCVLRSNQAAQSGTVLLHGSGTSASFSECIIANNEAPLHAGLLAEHAASLDVRNSSIEGNIATSGDGGGIAVTNNATAIFNNCKILANTATGWAAGGQILFGSASFAGCLFAGNVAGLNASALHLNNASSVVAIENCTFTANSGFGGPIGIQNTVSSISNTIVWGNTPASPLTTYSGSVPTVTYSCLEFGWPGLGNILVNPLLVGAGPEAYRLSAGSPAINGGENLLVPGSLDSDLAGNPRILRGTVDMGAFEYASEFPGTADDLLLEIRVNGRFAAASEKPALAGDVLDINISSPTGGLVGGAVFLGANHFLSSTPPALVLGVPGLQLDFFSILWFVDAAAPPPLGSAPLAVQGVQRSYVVPAGLNATSLRFQAAVLGPMALNGGYALSAAQQIEFP